jgi:hypothetical protein
LYLKTTTQGTEGRNNIRENGRLGYKEEHHDEYKNKKSLKILKCSSESVSRRRTGKAKVKWKRSNNNQQHTTQKDLATRTPLKNFQDYLTQYISHQYQDPTFDKKKCNAKCIS